MTLPHILALTLLLALSPPNDTDRDGLSDFQEIHKYFTDPEKADSDGDGVKDSDWNERREYTYTVRCVMLILPPCNLETMNDDYQDFRLLEKGDDCMKIEFVLYPFNTCAAAIGENRKWQRPDASVRRYVKPGVTTNWNKKMRKDILAALNTDGIDVGKLTDRETVEQVAAWLMERSKFDDCFTTFTAIFRNGKAKVAPSLRESVEKELAKRGRTLEEQWDRELFGRGMFYNRAHGSCTSSAIYLATGLKAAGIPMRTIVCFPVIDASDESEKALARKIEHHRVRRTILDSAADRGSSWASHTFNEAWIDFRWRRLNYKRLGQNILDRRCLGLMVHVHTFADHAEAGLVSWGLRNARRDKNDVFGHSNPYSCVSLSDLFGEHCRIDNPPVEEGHRVLTVSRIYWYHDENKPEVVQMRLDDEETAGHLVMHVGEGLLDDGPGQYKKFYEKTGKEFRLRAEGRPGIRAFATRGFWVDVEKDIKEFYLRIDPEEFSRMPFDVPYRLEAVDTKSDYRFVVLPGVTITRRDPDRKIPQ